ncbi:hypothetical protein G7007_17945 [Pseudomonas entomophila]|uniref:hypothetical protein n=1 Tax=Pseudomonas entomophila TaxID=312306 RepID=UPI0015E40D8E|nr:hypothetical protein [Pseudomonas entomophila]MBA1194720.1 hypothetical protein [Pseudomonas entomophila]
MNYLFWFSRIFLKIYVAAVLILIFLIGSKMISLADLTSSEAASWVQAIGSIVSIWGAFVISRKQFKHAEVRENKIKKEKEQAYISVREAAAAAARDLTKVVKEKPSAEEFRDAWGAHYEHFISSHITALGMVPMHELGEAGQITAHIHVASVLKNMHTSTQEYLSDGKWFEDNPSALYENIEMLYKWQGLQVELATSSFKKD